LNESSAIGQRLEYDLKCAENLPVLLGKSMNKLGSGRVILIAPWAWDRYASPLNYAMLKAGTITLTKAMAKRLAPSRINVNCIIPGFISGIKTPEMEREKMHELMDLIPMKTLGELHDIYEAICYFASDASKYVTGQCLEITGGMALDEKEPG
jgi:NAD(P)-dependent dehydrogenase (short-subunit alcohol dehydrogenase family)